MTNRSPGHLITFLSTILYPNNRYGEFKYLFRKIVPKIGCRCNKPRWKLCELTCCLSRSRSSGQLVQPFEYSPHQQKQERATHRDKCRLDYLSGWGVNFVV